MGLLDCKDPSIVILTPFTPNADGFWGFRKRQKKFAMSKHNSHSISKHIFLPFEPAEIQSEEIKIAGSPLEATILASMAPSMDSMQQQFSFIYLFWVSTFCFLPSNLCSSCCVLSRFPFVFAFEFMFAFTSAFPFVFPFVFPFEPLPLIPIGGSIFISIWVPNWFLIYVPSDLRSHSVPIYFEFPGGHA